MAASPKIIVETWEGGRNKPERLFPPTAQVLRAALSRLDGERTDSICIEIEGVGALVVGGGPDSYVVVSFPEDGSSSHVESGPPDNQYIELQVGGQTGNYPKTMALTLEVALGIAECFLVSRIYDPTTTWVTDCAGQQ